MTVSALAVAFNTGTGGVGTTVDVTGSIAISGTSVVIFFMAGRTDSTDAAGRATRWRGCGWAVSATDRRAQVSQDQDAVAAHAGGSYHSDAACILSNTTGTTIDGALDFDSWLSNGFRLIVDDVMPRSYRIIALIVTGLDNAESVSWLDINSTGNKVVTSGLSFQPDVVFGMATTIDTNPPGGRSGNENLGIGFAVSSSARAVLAGGADEGSATTDTDSYCTDAEFLATLTASVGSVLGSRYDFVSMNSNGFTINELIVPSTLCWNHFLAIKGGSWTVRSISTQTDTSTDINTSSLGFTPKGAIIMSAMKSEHAAGTPTVHDTWSVGVASGASDRYACALRSEDGVADTVVYTAIEHDEVYIAISSTPGVEGLMDVKTWADPITFIMDDADPSAKFVTMLIVGTSGQTVTVNQVTETDAAQPLVHVKQKAIGQVSETDLAQALMAQRKYAVAQVSETDLAQALSARKIKGIAQIEEIDTAQPVTPAGNETIVPVAQVTETDSAQPIASRKIKTITQVIESDEAQAVTGRKFKVVSQVLESDQAQTLTSRKIKTIAQVSESDAAQALTHGKAKVIGQVSESDLAQALSRIKRKLLLQVTELDTAQSISSVSGILVQQVEETDLAQALFKSKRVAVVQVVELDLSQPVTAKKIRLILQVIETDLAQPISAINGLIVTISIDAAVVPLELASLIIGLASNAMSQLLSGNVLGIDARSVTLVNVNAEEDLP